MRKDYNNGSISSQKYSDFVTDNVVKNLTDEGIKKAEIEQIRKEAGARQGYVIERKKYKVGYDLIGQKVLDKGVGENGIYVIGQKAEQIRKEAGARQGYVIERKKYKVGYDLIGQKVLDKGVGENGIYVIGQKANIEVPKDIKVLKGLEKNVRDALNNNRNGLYQIEQHMRREMVRFKKELRQKLNEFYHAQRFFKNNIQHKQNKKFSLNTFYNNGKNIISK